MQYQLLLPSVSQLLAVVKARARRGHMRNVTYVQSAILIMISHNLPSL